MADEAVQIEMSLGPVLLKTKADKRTEELFDALENEIVEMKEAVPNLAGYYIFAVDADRTIYSSAEVAKHCPHHRLMWPEMVRNSCFMDLLMREQPSE